MITSRANRLVRPTRSRSALCLTSSFILPPSSLSLHTCAFILPPSSLSLHPSAFILDYPRSCQPVVQELVVAVDQSPKHADARQYAWHGQQVAPGCPSN